MGVGTTTSASVNYSDNAPTVAVPSGAVAGNLYVLAVEYMSSATITWPSGFTEVGASAYDSNIGARLRVAIRTATGTESGSFVCSLSSYSNWVATCTVVSGYSAPAEAVSANNTYAYTNSAAMTGASVTTTGANRMILWVGATGSAGTASTVTYTAPTGLTKNATVDNGIGITMSVAYGVQASAGAATYSGTASFGATSDSRAGTIITLALAPSGGAAALASSVTATSTATASLTVGAKLAASVAALATVTAALTVGAKLSSSPVAVSTASASLQVGVGFASTVTAASAATAGLTTSINLGGSLSASASASADLRTGASLASVLAAVSSSSGALTTSINLGGSVGASSLASGALLTQIAMAASAASTPAASATLTAASAFVGMAPAASTASGSLSTQIKLGGQAWSVGAISGDLTTGISLAGTAQASSSGLAAVSSGAALLSGVAASDAVAVGRLTVYQAIWSGPASHSWSIPKIVRHCTLLEREDQREFNLKTAIHPIDKRSAETLTRDIDARRLLGDGITLVDVLSVTVEPETEVALTASGAVINTDATVIEGESVPVGKVVQIVLAGGMAGVNKTGRPYLVRIMCATSRAPEAVELTVPVLVDDYPYLS